MTFSLSVDPGREALAWAVWYNGHLIDCGLSRGPKTKSSFTQASISAVASAALAVIPKHPYVSGAVERMKVYGGPSNKDPNDLLDLQAIGGLVMGHFVPPSGTVYFYPSEWMGGSPPTKIMQLRITGKLDGRETEIFQTALAAYPRGLRHNVYDACGIGLKLHGRMRNAA